VGTVGRRLSDQLVGLVVRLGQENRSWGCVRIPSGAFVTQLARNLVADLAERGRSVKFLVRDRDAKFTASFDEVLRSDHIRVIKRLSGHLEPTRPRSAG
jgi:hypothetical protein